MTDNPNVAVKDRFIAAVLGGDTETVNALLDPEMVLEQPVGLVYAGTYYGAEGFMEFLRLFADAYEIEVLDNTRTFFCNDPDVIVLEFHFRGTFRPTGEAFDTSQLEHWYFRNGKVLKVRPHWFEMPTLAG